MFIKEGVTVKQRFASVYRVQESNLTLVRAVAFLIFSILAVLPYADTSSQNTNKRHSNADNPYKHIESHMY